MCLFGAVSDNLSSLAITVNYLSHLVSALCSLALSIIPLAGIDLYKMGRYLT